jgi:hypothetical protein
LTVEGGAQIGSTTAGLGKGGDIAVSVQRVWPSPAPAPVMPAA